MVGFRREGHGGGFRGDREEHNKIIKVAIKLASSCLET